MTPCCVSLSKLLEFSGPQVSGLTAHSDAGIPCGKLRVNCKSRGIPSFVIYSNR